MSLYAAFTELLKAKVEGGEDVTGYNLERQTRPTGVFYYLHLPTPYPLPLGTEDEATEALYRAADKVREVTETLAQKSMRNRARRLLSLA